MSLITRNAKEYRSITAQLMSQNLPIVITSSTKSEFWHFHIVVAQRRANKCTKKRDAHAKLLFCLSNLLLFCRSCCYPRPSFLLKLSINCTPSWRLAGHLGKTGRREGEREENLYFFLLLIPFASSTHFPCYLGVAQIE